MFAETKISYGAPFTICAVSIPEEFVETSQLMLYSSSNKTTIESMANCIFAAAAIVIVFNSGSDEEQPNKVAIARDKKISKRILLLSIHNIT